MACRCGTRTLIYARLGFTRVNQPSGPQPGQHFIQARVGDGEAAFAAPKHAAAPDHISAYIPRAVHHDSPRRRVAVAGVEILETYRVAVGTYIRGVGSKGA